MAGDPTYGGRLTRVDNKWQLEVLVEFDQTAMTGYSGKLDAIKYRIYEAPAHSEREFASPDGLMIFASTVNTFSEDTYVVIVQGYHGWKNASTVPTQYFIQAGLKTTQQTADALGEFSLRFSGGPSVPLDATTLRLHHRKGTEPDLVRPVVAVSGENTVEVNGLQAMGYYVLI